MYKVYLKQAWALMGQNRFFTAVYIIGTGLAISMVMVYRLAGDEDIGAVGQLRTQQALPILKFQFHRVYSSLMP